MQRSAICIIGMQISGGRARAQVMEAPDCRGERIVEVVTATVRVLAVFSCSVQTTKESVDGRVAREPQHVGATLS